MRAVLSTFGSRGDVAPAIGPPAEPRTLGAEARVCAPPDAEFARLTAGVGASHVPIGPSVRDMLGRSTPGSSKDASRLAAELVAMQLETRTTASGCAALETALDPATRASSAAAQVRTDGTATATTPLLERSR